jgi:hypothetical protein
MPTVVAQASGDGRKASVMQQTDHHMRQVAMILGLLSQWTVLLSSPIVTSLT